MKRQLHKTILSLVKNLTGHIKAIKNGYDRETIHELRTGFKKLRALLRWQKAEKKAYDPVRNAYAIAGELRNIQVAQEKLKEEKDIPQSFQNWLAVSIGKIKKEWTKINFRKTCDEFYESVNNADLRFKKNNKFFSDKIKTAEQLLAADPVSDISLHKCRKMIKDMQYVLEWWKSKMGKPRQFVKDVSINKLETASKQIGSYNDTRMLLILLTTYAQQEKDPLCIAAINPVIDRWQYNKSEAKEKVLAILRYEKINESLIYKNKKAHSI